MKASKSSSVWFHVTKDIVSEMQSSMFVDSGGKAVASTLWVTVVVYGLWVKCKIVIL